MATYTGTSVLGYQQLNSAIAAPSGQARITFPDFPNPPPVRVGYAYVYTVQLSGNFQAFVIASEIIRRPGLALNLDKNFYGSGFGMRVDVVWNLPGLRWSLVTT